MQITPKATGLALVVLATLVLTGCVQQPPHVIPTSDPSVEPVFKSDAAALAAAKKAYLAYSAMSDTIGLDGGKHPERIAKWVTASDLVTETKVFNDFAKTGDHLTGESVISYFALQQVSQARTGRVDLTAYVCDDVSGSHLVSATGDDVTPPSRQNLAPLQVQFKNASPGSKTLLIDGSQPWSGQNFCS